MSLGDSNKHRYVVATQSLTLRGRLRAIPAVPLVHVTRSVMILEPPTDATLRAKALVRLCNPVFVSSVSQSAGRGASIIAISGGSEATCVQFAVFRTTTQGEAERAQGSQSAQYQKEKEQESRFRCRRPQEAHIYR